jgi:peptidoglycan/LPS O-acetylase OafA/YrhL
LGRNKGTYVALGVIVLSPAVRLISYVIFPSMRGGEWAMLHTRLDTIMFGCVMALLWKEPRFHKWIERFLKPVLISLAVCYIAILSPLLSARFQARYEWPVGYTMRAMLISLVLLYFVKKPMSGPGRVLNYALVRHIGVISYSLYLWQQMFTGAQSLRFPINIVSIIVCAELSYFLVERPTLRLRDRLMGRSASLGTPSNWERPTVSQGRPAAENMVFVEEK